MRKFCSLLILGMVLSVFSIAMMGQSVHKNAPVWKVGAVYKAGDVVAFENSSYKCLYAHTAVTGWEPAKTASLWKSVSTGKVTKADPVKPAVRGKRAFAPYVYMSEATNNLPEIQVASGTKVFTMAFIVAGNGCTPVWHGNKGLTPIENENVFGEYIDRVRKAGGDVIVSFGGYSGTELAMACTDVASLTEAYQKVIDRYKFKSLDFDIEAAAATDMPSIERRSEAIAKLMQANPGLQISFTVPVVGSGMPQTALDLLKSAHQQKVTISVVNLMAMDYGQPIPENNMGPLAIMAVENSMAQLKTLGIEAGIGITPMIGRNDTPGETFTLSDATMTARYAAKNPAVRRLSMWSVGRDRGCEGAVSPTCSGVAQGDWAFSHIFQEF